MTDIYLTISLLGKTYYGSKVFVIYDVGGLAVPLKMLSMKHRCSVSYPTESLQFINQRMHI